VSEEQLTAKLAHWIKEPIDFVRENFGVEPDAFQVQVLNWYRDGESHIAMQACKGPGKTAVLAWIALHFMLFENANIAAVSTSGANTRNNLWKEIALWRDKSPWYKQTYEMTATRLYVPSDETHDYEKTWFAEMRTWSKTADDATVAQTLQGLHANNVMVLLDESGGMPDGLMVAAEGIMANKRPGDGKRAHIIQAGNPTMLKGPLYRAATKERSHWKVIEITGDPLDPNRCPRIGIEWAQQQIDKHGRDHPWVLVNVMGKFPPASFNALIGPEEVSAAIGRHFPKEAYENAPKVIGADIARYGDDEAVVWPRQGLVAFIPESFRHAHPDDLAGHTLKLANDWAAMDGVEVTAYMADATGGYGDGYIDSLGRIGITAMRVQFAGKPIDPKFYNKRSEIIWNLVEWIKSGGSLPPGEWSDHVLEELTVTLYTFVKDKILLEEKDMVKAKLGRSPDYSDALACTFAFPVTRSFGGFDRAQDFNKAKTDYDVLARA
jgi:hypothetical protein